MIKIRVLIKAGTKRNLTNREIKKVKIRWAWIKTQVSIAANKSILLWGAIRQSCLFSSRNKREGGLMKNRLEIEWNSCWEATMDHKWVLVEVPITALLMLIIELTDFNPGSSQTKITSSREQDLLQLKEPLGQDLFIKDKNTWIEVSISNWMMKLWRRETRLLNTIGSICASITNSLQLA